MKQDIEKIEADIIAAAEGVRALRRVLANNADRAALVKIRDHIGTLHANAFALQSELTKVLPVLVTFLEESK